MRQLLLLFSCLIITILSNAQKVSINNVYKIYIKNTGPISEGDQIKGYYVFYQADKVDRKTNEYAIQILDQNTNLVKETKFTDNKEIELLDAEFNGSSLCFFFLNKDKKEFDYRIYDLDGKLKYTYTKPYDNGDLWLFTSYRNQMSEDGPSNSLIAVHNKGFITLLPARKGGSNYFEFGYYSSEQNSEWVYKPEVEERQVFTFFLSATDSVAYLELTKKKSVLGGEPKNSIMALNFITKKQLYEINDDQFDPSYKVSALSMKKSEDGSGNIEMIANYFDKDANTNKDFAKGMAFYTMSPNGKMLSKVYNSWQGDFSKYLSVNDKGKVEDLGFLSIQDIVKTPDGKLYAIAEGYKRNANAAGIALSLLARNNVGVTKIMITDMVLLEFDKNLKIRSAKTLEKHHRTGVAGQLADYASQHALATMLKMSGSFDYEFTTSNKDKSAFAFCFTDYEKNDDYKGLVFNSLKYRDGKFTTDKIPLNTKATSLRILPAKAGFVTIVEYFKKEKRLDFRLEKIG